jgi:predicted regulator of amino acid metabolism with ACT domain
MHDASLMWYSLSKYFGRYPSQGRVARLLLTNGLRVKEGRVYSGDVEIGDMALARAAKVDRRIVRSAVETIESHEELRQVFSAILPTAMLKEVAPVMGWSCIEIIPTDAHVPGILADVTGVIAEEGITVRQALVDDPELFEEPRLYVITESEVPPELIPRIKTCRGVKSILIH